MSWHDRIDAKSRRLIEDAMRAEATRIQQEAQRMRPMSFTYQPDPPSRMAPSYVDAGDTVHVITTLKERP